VSLLLDALKRAEQEKHTRNGERPPPPTPLAAPSAANSPTGALELQPLGGASAPPRSEAAAHAAQALFQAKTARDDASANRGMLWATVGVIAVIVAAAAAYVWYSLRTLTPQLVAAAAVRPPPAPTPQPASGMTIGELPATLPAAPVAASAPVAESATPAAPPREPPARRAAALASELLRERPAPAEPETRLARTQEPAARIPADVTTAYAALRNGDLATARRSYQAALAADPRGIDANLGMATLEARAGNRPVAAAHYRKVLDSDPRNVTALAGLAAIADFGRAEGLETRLREDIARHPGNAPLHSALGNMFASQSRWHDAQAEYFEALRLDPANADVAYNLAVSLDHLGQARLAADHYRRALEAARSQPAQFDARQVEQRLTQLSTGAR
jgi:tetratricopeptide (TPR) repeat protein